MKNKKSQSTTVSEQSSILRQIYSQVRKLGLDTVMERELDITDEQAGKLMTNIVDEWQRRSGKGFYQDGNNMEVIKKIMRYFLMRDDTGLDKYKGICLYGDYGTGKTQIMEFFMVFTHAIGWRKFRMNHCRMMEIDVAQNGADGITMQLGQHVCYNDLGLENLTTKVYGNEMSVMEYILTARADERILTHATTNLPPEMLFKRYGKRMESRFHELFNFIHLEGHDKRKLKLIIDES